MLERGVSTVNKEKGKIMFLSLTGWLNTTVGTRS
jgi:hypothetical protein